MDMTSRNVRDGIVLVSSFHFLMAFLSLVGAAAAFVFAVLPPLTLNADNLAQSIFFPVVAVVLGLILAILYLVVGMGLMRFSNTARIASIFLSVLGLLSGFVGVLGAMIIRLGGPSLPNLISVALIGLATMCGYGLLAFMDVFVLVFLFNRQVRGFFYGDEWAVAPEEE